MKKENELKMIAQLAKNDLKARYSGSVLGIVWAYIQPLITILVFWYVFQVGFRNSPVDNVEYILWFVAGYIPWMFFNDGLISSSNVFYEYSYLVKKMKFKIWQLPIVKIISSFGIHTFFLVFILCLYMLYGYVPNIAWISIFYYSLAIAVLLFGLSFIVASLSVLFKDIAQLVSVILQIGFWMTPIFWNETQMTETALKVLKLNPLYYIITGYRAAMIEGKGFWQMSPKLTLYYWVGCIVFILIGLGVYKKLKPHFSDLL